MELRSARVRIRPWQRHDDELADAWPPYNEPLEAIWNLPRQHEWSSSWFESGSTRRTWAVDDSFGQLIGRISLREIDERRRQSRLGITLNAPSVGKGLGTESLRLFLDYYFTELGFDTMVLDVAAPNVRAVRCYEGLGFRHTGTDWRAAGYAFDAHVLSDPAYASVRQHFRQNHRGHQVEFYEMQLSRDEWFSQRVRGQ